jgi:hypothetical protein
MTDERSPAVERLFAAANRELADEAFVASVMAKTGKINARSLTVALAVCLAAAPVAWLLAQPLNDAFGWLIQLMSRPLAGGGGDGIASIVLPINSIGGVLALALLVCHSFSRRLFGENN